MQYYFRRNGVVLEQMVENKESAIKGAKLLGVDRVYYTENGLECWFLVGDPSTTSLKEAALELEKQKEVLVKSSVAVEKTKPADSANMAAASYVQNLHGKKLCVVRDAVPLYAAPSDKSTQVGVVNSGIQFEFVAESNGFCFCKYKKGWIKTELLDIVL